MTRNIRKHELTTTILDVAVTFHSMARGSTYFHPNASHVESFEFTDNGREYWGELVREKNPAGYVVVSIIRTRNARTGHGVLVRETAMSGWRTALAAAMREHVQNFADSEGASIESKPVEAAPISLATVEAANARHATADAIEQRRATLGAVWKARLDVESGVAADEGDWKYVGTPLHAVYLAAHNQVSRFKLHAFIEQDYNPNHRVRVSRYVDLSKPALPPRPAATVHDFPPAVARVSVARRVIDITPTWTALVPVLMAVLEDGTPEGKRTAREVLTRMAKVADMAVAQDAAA